jgi:hypothetical protein
MTSYLSSEGPTDMLHSLHRCGERGQGVPGQWGVALPGHQQRRRLQARLLRIQGISINEVQYNVGMVERISTFVTGSRWIIKEPSESVLWHLVLALARMLCFFNRPCNLFFPVSVRPRSPTSSAASCCRRSAARTRCAASTPGKTRHTRTHTCKLHIISIDIRLQKMV